MYFIGFEHLKLILLDSLRYVDKYMYMMHI